MAAALATVVSFLLVVLVSVAHGWNKDCPPPGSGSSGGAGGGHHGKPPEHHHHHHHKPPPSPRCPSCHPPYTPPTPRPPPTPPYVPPYIPPPTPRPPPSPPYVPSPPPYVPPYIPPPTPPYVPPYIPPPTPPYVPPYIPPPTPPYVPPYVPPPSPPATGKTCPIDALKLNACVDVLGGLIHLVIGQKARAKCCPLVQGVADLDAALCLCTTIRARLLNINIYLPVALELLITCGKHPPPGFKCPPLYGA